MHVTPAIAGVGPAPRGALPCDVPGQPTPGQPDVFRMVTLGDSLTSGTQDGVTVQARQERAYVKQLADHAGIPLNMPYLSGQGVPFSVFQDKNADMGRNQRQMLKLGVAVAPLGIYTHFVGTPDWIAPVWDTVPGFGQRTPESRDTVQNPQGNFAVPGSELRHLQQTATMGDYLREVHEGLQGLPSLAQEVPLIRATLGNGRNAGNGSQADQALAKDPHLAVIWAGGSDAYAALFCGRLDDNVLTPCEDRSWTYQVTNPVSGKSHMRVDDGPREGFRSQMVGPEGLIPRFLNDSTAEIMLLNLPDVTVAPLLREVGKPVGDLPFRVVLKDGQDVTESLEKMVIPTAVQGPGHGGRAEFPEGTRVNLATLVQRLAQSGLPYEPGQALLGEDDVLDPQELAAISSRIAEYNAIIQDAGRLSPRVHIVDVNAAMADIQANGRELRGEGEAVIVGAGMTGATDSAGRDGIFSYDGVHPSDTGHAVLANLVLDKIKSDLGERPEFSQFRELAPIDEKAVHSADPHKPDAARLVLDEISLDQWTKAGRV